MDQITQAFKKAAEHVFSLETAEVELSFPESRFGDVSTNIALKLSRQLNKSPRNIAQEIIGAVSGENYSWLKQIEIAGPGFINVYVTDEFLWNSTNREIEQFLSSKKIVYEYSCPNAFKELHAGHLYQTLVGDVLSRIAERAGATVIRTNFGGDVGLHVAKTMWGIKQKTNNFSFDSLNSIDKNDRANFLSSAYVEGAREYEANNESTAEINELNKRIYEIHNTHDKESDDARVYWECRKWSYDYFVDFYKSIEVSSFDRFYPESETAPIGLKLVHEHEAVFEKSDGALIYRGEDEGLHTRVFVTSEDLPTYETKDLGVIKLEHDEYNFDERYLITGNDQSEYMKVVFSATSKTMPEVANKMTHITNGTIRFGDGKKMSSRLGNVARAVDVIATAESLVEDQDARKIVSLGAVKYSFLRQRVGGDIAFDASESVNIHGNSGPYLQYAVVRAKSIVSKVTTQVPASYDFQDSERELVQKLSNYSYVIETAVKELAPQHICTYLYELAQIFNRFYENNRVIGDARESVRAAIITRYITTLTDGLKLLGISVPDHM